MRTAIVCKSAVRDRLRLIGCGALILSVAVLARAAADSLSAASARPSTVIKFGMSTVLSGTAASLGINMRAGVLAAFEEANRAGGVHGRRIECLVRDDAYEPSRTGPAVRELTEKENVLALVGDVGTPTAVVAVPICRETGTLYIGAFTGAGILRPTPPDPVIFNFRASYAEETGAMVDALIDRAGLGPADIGFLTQRDAYGDAGFSGGMAALKRRGLPESTKPLHVRYERNTVDVESAVADCLTAPRRPRVMIMVGAYAPCAAFIRLCRESGFNPHFINVSFVGPESLAKALGAVGDGEMITQVVPTLDTQFPAAAAFRAALAALPPEVHAEPTLGSLEGYAVGRMVLSALGRIPADEIPTRANLAAALDSLGEFDVGLGERFRLDAANRQASHRVWPSILRDGQVVAFDWNELKNPVSEGASADAVVADPIRP